jgi:hypothetical protein
MSNRFGRSAACKLSRQLQARLAVHNCKRGCTLQGSIAPTCGFADDSPLHTDGPDTVQQAMAIMVPKVADDGEWAGMEINMIS